MIARPRAVAAPATRGVDASRAIRPLPATAGLLLCVVAFMSACTPGSAPGSPGGTTPLATATTGGPSGGSVGGSNSGVRQVASGIVVSVEGGLGATSSFTLRTADGQQVVFRVAQVELDGDAFPPQHLREHQASAEAVSVTYERRGDDLVAVRLEDAR